MSRKARHAKKFYWQTLDYRKWTSSLCKCHSSGPVAYLAQVTHLAGKFHLHCCLFALLLPCCISGTSHTPCWEVPSALLPVCSAVSPAYKNFSCSPSFFSSFLFFFLPCISSSTSIQVSSLKPSQVKVTKSVRLEFCSAIASSHYKRPTQP